MDGDIIAPANGGIRAAADSGVIGPASGVVTVPTDGGIIAAADSGIIAPADGGVIAAASGVIIAPVNGGITVPADSGVITPANGGVIAGASGGVIGPADSVIIRPVDGIIAAASGVIIGPADSGIIVAANGGVSGSAGDYSVGVAVTCTPEDGRAHRLQGERGDEEREGDDPGDAVPDAAGDGCPARVPGAVGAGREPRAGERDERQELAAGVDGADLLGDDREAMLGERGAQVAGGDEVLVLRLEPADPPRSEQPALRRLRVGDLDHQVPTRREYVRRGGEFGSRAPGVLQVVEHADDVVVPSEEIGRAHV